MATLHTAGHRSCRLCRHARLQIRSSPFRRRRRMASWKPKASWWQQAH